MLPRLCIMTVVIPARVDVTVVKALVSGDVKATVPVHVKGHVREHAKVTAMDNVHRQVIDNLWMR